ncbi:MAG TPA: hypothetical protein VG125_28025 [Pirellulales bacterium]|jgi:hypothetical protein|nr:hypothetical protein [Pirellulales bacterium]
MNRQSPLEPEIGQDQATAADAQSNVEGEREAAHRSTIEMIKNLPTPVGLLLLGLGVVGVVLPGPMGAPLVVASGLVLAPRTFTKVEKCVRKRFPHLHQAGLAIVERYVNDLEKRYPTKA